MENKFGLPENFCKFEKELLNQPSVHTGNLYLKNEAKRQKQEKVDYTALNEVYISGRDKICPKI